MPPRLKTPSSLPLPQCRPSQLSRRPLTTSSSTSTSTQPFHVAIIGSGPAGFWTAQSLLRKHPSTKIDMFERLPVPFGLVRYGVAPDHGEVRNCEDIFWRVAKAEGFAFRGGVDVNINGKGDGRGVSLQEVAGAYDAVVLATGADVDRGLGVPGEDGRGVMSARGFVGWYTGLPGCEGLEPDVPDRGEVVIVGQGNVAMDVSRILLMGVDRLRGTDMPEYALELLSRRRVRKVTVVGRRGPVQAKFTIKELRELIRLEHVTFEPVSPHFFPPDLKTLDRPQRRIAELLLKETGQSHISRDINHLSPLSTPHHNPQPTTSQPGRSVSLSFLLSPLAFTTDSSNNLTGLNCARTWFDDTLTAQQGTLDPYSPNAATFPIPDAHAHPVHIPATLALKATGYATEPLPVDVPKNVYTVGWARMGGRGVLAGTMEDAGMVGGRIVGEFLAGGIASEEPTRKGGWENVRGLLDRRNVRVTGWKEWERINEFELEKGKEMGKDREKITSVDGMMKVLDG